MAPKSQTTIPLNPHSFLKTSVNNHSFAAQGIPSSYEYAHTAPKAPPFLNAFLKPKHHKER